MSRSVHIVALAARTPVGLTPETAAAAVRAGISGVQEHPFMVDALGEPLRAACVPDLDPRLLGWRRILALAHAGMRQLGERLATTHLVHARRASLLLGLPEHRPGWSEHDSAATIAELARVELPGSAQLVVEDLARGHAAALECARVGFERIRAGALDWCIVGGVDSYLDADTLDWLALHRQVKTERTRSSFFPGEAAGFVVLAAGDLVRSAGLQSLGELVGAGSAQERALIKTEDVCVGRALAAAIARASETAQLGVPADDIYCDINGERYRSEEWGMAMLQIYQHVADGTIYHLPVSSWGDIGAASGALFVTLALRAWARGYARGDSALVWAGSEGGLRAALVVGRGS